MSGSWSNEETTTLINIWGEEAFKVDWIVLSVTDTYSSKVLVK